MNPFQFLWVNPYTIYLALRDKRIPGRIKALILLIVIGVTGYILSPVDLIPELTPFIGWLDDLILLPLAARYIPQLIPEPVRDELLSQSRVVTNRFRTVFIILTVFFILLVLLVLTTITYLIIRAVRG